MNINGIELKIDFFDADDIEKIENATKEVLDLTTNNQERNLSMSQAIREECKIIDGFFDKVFGEGTAKKVFKKDNLLEHVEAFEKIINEKVNQQKGFQNMYNRYKPNDRKYPNIKKYSSRK